MMTKSTVVSRMWLVVSFLGLAGAPVLAQTNTVEVDPIRCWWRTSSGAVRTGETFSLALTCAVLENDDVQVVPDEGRLASNVIQLAPFEIVSGTHPEDLRTSDRRFFQYDYRLRLINPDFIGRDVLLPDLLLHYRVNSRLPGNAALQGRDQMYVLPRHSVRILSIVPNDAGDIRDSTGSSFAIVDQFRLRARILQIVAITMVVVGSLMVLWVLLRLIARARRGRTADARDQTIGMRRVVRLAARELSDVQREVESQGWTDRLVSRALAASRVIGAAALGRSTSQRVTTNSGVPGAEPHDDLGTIAESGRRSVRRISSAVTTRDIATRLAAIPDTNSDTRDTLARVQSALTAFTSAQYARTPSLDRGPLDQALSDAIASARRIRSRQASPVIQIRRWFGQRVDVA